MAEGGAPEPALTLREALLPQAHERLGHRAEAADRLQQAIRAVHHAADASMLQQRLHRLTTTGGSTTLPP